MKRGSRICKAVLAGCLSLVPKTYVHAQDFVVPSGTTSPPIVVNGGTTGTIQKGGTITSAVPATVPLEIQSSGFTTNLDGTISSTGLKTGGILISGMGGKSAINIGSNGLLSTTDFGIQSTASTDVTVTITGKINSGGRSIYLNGGTHKIDVSGGLINNDIDLIGNSNDTVNIANGTTLQGNLFLNGGTDNVHIAASTVQQQISFGNAGTSTLLVRDSVISSTTTSIFATGGDRTITLDNATGGKEIVLQAGNYTVTVQNGSNFSGQLFGTGGTLKYSVLNSVFGGAISGQGSSNSITIQNGGASKVFGQGAGVNAISISNSTIKGEVFLQNGSDQSINIYGSTLAGQVFIQGAGGSSNTINLASSTIGGQVFAQNGLNQSIVIKGGSVNGQVFTQGSGVQTIVIENVGGSSNQVFVQNGTGNSSVSVINHPVTSQVFAQGTGNLNVLVQNAGTLSQVFAQGVGNHTVTVKDTTVTNQVFATNGGSHTVTVENAGDNMNQILAQGSGSQTINVKNTKLTGIIEAQSGGTGGNNIVGDKITTSQIISNGGAAKSNVTLTNSTVNGQIALNGNAGDTLNLTNSKVNTQIVGSTGSDTINLNNSSSVKNSVFGNAGTDTVNIANSSSVGGDVSNTGTIIVNAASNSSIGGNIFGQAGNDQVNLTNGSSVGKNIFLGSGDNKVTVDASTVSGEIGVGTGNDVVTLQNGGVVQKNIDFGGTGTDILNIINGGTVNGASRGVTLNINGGGIANLNSFVVFTGKSTIAGANANVIGTLTSNQGVDVLASGILSGNGTVNTALLDIQNGGAVAPTGTGTLLVQGKFQSTNGNFYANLNGANSNLLNVAGSASITGGTINVTTTPGGTYAPGQSWKILSTTVGPNNANLAQLNVAGGLTGMYSNVQDDLAFVKFIQVATPDQLSLLAQSDFAGPAQTFNQIAIGNYLNSIYSQSNGDLKSSLNTLLGLSAANGLNAFNLLSGEIHGSSMTISLEQNSLYLRNIMNHIRSTEQGSSTASFLGAPQTASTNQGSSTGIQQAAYEVAKDPERIWRDIEIVGPATRAWMVGFGTGGNAQSDGNAQAFQFALTGGTIGVDRWIDPTVLVGVNTGYGYAYINGENQSGTNNINSFQISAYGRKDLGLAYLMGAVGYAHDSFNAHRDIVIGPIARRANAKYDGNEFISYLESGLRYDVNGWRFVPMAAVQYLLAGQNSFTETGAGALNLAVSGQTADSLRSIVGIHLARTPVADGWKINPFGYARWSHEYLNQDRIVTASFAASGPAGFSIRGANLGHDYLNTGIGAEMQFRSWLRSSLYYDFQVSNQSDAHTLAGQLEFRW